MVYGPMVSLYIRGGSVWGPYTNGSTAVELCELPERLRPVITCGCAWVTPGGASYGVIYAEHDGRLIIQKSAGTDTNYYQACVSYLVSDAA